jgi:hypothetical protein
MLTGQEPTTLPDLCISVIWVVLGVGGVNGVTRKCPKNCLHGCHSEAGILPEASQASLSYVTKIPQTQVFLLHIVTKQMIQLRVAVYCSRMHQCYEDYFQSECPDHE